MSVEFEEDNRMTVPAMLLDEKASKRVASVMTLLGCNESAAIKRIIAACRREDIIKELNPDAEQQELPEGPRSGVQDGEGAGGSGDGAQQRKRSPSPGPPDSPKAGVGKAKGRSRSQSAAKQGRKVSAVKFQGRTSKRKQVVPQDPPRSAGRKPSQTKRVSRGRRTK